MGQVIIDEDFIVAGDFDSRKRYLKLATNGAIAIVNGITWRMGFYNEFIGQPWTSYVWSMGEFGRVSFTAVTVDSETERRPLDPPTQTIRKCDF